MHKILMLMILVPFIAMAQNGLVKNYYPDGKLESEVNYLNGVREGEAKFYNPNGTLKEERLYINGRVDGIVRVYSDSGVIREVINLEQGKRNGPVSLYNEKGIYAGDVTFEEGIKAYTPEVTSEPEQKPVFVYNETDKNNKQKTKSETEMSIPPVIEEPVYKDNEAYDTTAEVMPEPIGGMDNIHKRVYYPMEAKKRKIEGTVKILAYIDENGLVQRADVVEKLGYGCDDAAQITVFYTRFKPGLIKGRPVKVQMVIPVEFKLPD